MKFCISAIRLPCTPPPLTPEDLCGGCSGRGRSDDFFSFTDVIPAKRSPELAPPPPPPTAGGGESCLFWAICCEVGADRLKLPPIGGGGGGGGVSPTGGGGGAPPTGGMGGAPPTDGGGGTPLTGGMGGAPPTDGGGGTPLTGGMGGAPSTGGGGGVPPIGIELLIGEGRGETDIGLLADLVLLIGKGGGRESSTFEVTGVWKCGMTTGPSTLAGRDGGCLPVDGTAGGIAGGCFGS